MTIKKVPIAVVATILGKSEQFVRRGLIAGKLPFGIMGGLCEPCKRFITLPNSAYIWCFTAFGRSICWHSLTQNSEQKISYRQRFRSQMSVSNPTARLKFFLE